jgi:hypothetical protein
MNTLGRASLMAALAAGTLLLVNIQKRESRMALQIAMLAILPIDAFTQSPGIAPTLPSAALAPGIWQSSGKPPLALGEGRIMISPDAEQKLLYSQVAEMRADFIGKRLAEWYNLNLLDNLPKVNGAVTLRPADFSVLEGYLYYTRGGHCGSGLVDFLSVAWLSSPDDPVVWLQRKNYLPMITAGQKPVFAEDDETLQAITAKDFEPQNVVYLPGSEHSLVAVTNSTACNVTKSNFSMNHVEAEVQAQAPSLVVLSQSYYHLWQVSVDGKPASLLRANLAFQAVEVPAGEHHIEWAYRDPLLEIGALISLVSLAACVLIYLPKSGGKLPCPFTF